MKSDQYRVVVEGISADDIFSGIYSIVLILAFATSTLSVRGKKRLSENQVDNLNRGNQILVVGAALITFIYALFHIYAALVLKVPMLAVRRLPHGILLLGSTLGLVFGLLGSIKKKIEEDRIVTSSIVEWIGELWQNASQVSQSAHFN